MTRAALLAACLMGPPALAVGVIPPIPRLPAEKLIPVASPSTPDGPTSEDDPAAILDRITKTADAVGDRLKEKDTGADTRKQQEQLLKDIDALLKPPPPMSSGGADMPPPMGGGADMPPPMGGGADMPPPMGGGSGGGRQRPPRGSRGEGQSKPMGAGGTPEPMPGSPKPEPMQKGTGSKPGQPAGGSSGDGDRKASPPALPLDVPIAKEVWGHLPEKARQEVSQYYREQYLPRYNDLLKQYYTAQAERERKGKK